jgi:dTDP-glucose pyrophosphorylase
MINWKKSIISDNKSIAEAIKKIEISEIKICFVINNKKEFLGTITDGDIRRALIKNYSLKSNLKNIINYKALRLDQKINKMTVIRKMREREIQYIPILDNKKNIINIHLANDQVQEKKKNIFFIFGGGRGERLKPITNTIPKPMIKIANKPLLEHVILKAKEDGFFNFAISVYYKKKIIKDYFKSGKNLGVNISYIEEKKPLGTAGALSLLKKNNNLPIVICNGDLMSKINFDSLLAYHNKNKSIFTAVTSEHNIQNPFGTIKLKKNKIISFKEKPINKSIICTGAYVMDPKMLNKIKKNLKLDMPDLIKKLIFYKNKVLSYPIFEPWLDIGTHENYKQANLKKKINK